MKFLKTVPYVTYLGTYLGYGRYGTTRSSSLHKCSGVWKKVGAGTYLEEKGSDEEALSLAVAHLAVVHAVGLADPVEGLLPRPPGLPEELVGGEGAVDVAEYDFLIGSVLKCRCNEVNYCTGTVPLRFPEWKQHFWKWSFHLLTVPYNLFAFVPEARS